MIGTDGEKESQGKSVLPAWLDNDADISGKMEINQTVSEYENMTKWYLQNDFIIAELFDKAFFFLFLFLFFYH